MSRWADGLNRVYKKHPEYKQYAYNAGLTNKPNGGITSIASAAILFALGKGFSNLEDLPKLNKNDIDTHIGRFMKFLEENPVRGEVKESAKMQHLQRLGRLFEDGLDIIRTTELDAPAPDTFDNEKNQNAYEKDTLEGTVLRIGYFGNLMQDRLTDPSQHSEQERASFYSGYGGLEKYNKTKKQTQFLSSMHILSSTDFQSNKTKETGAALGYYAKNNMPKPDQDATLDDILENKDYLEEHAEKTALEIGYITGQNENQDKNPEEAVKKAQQAAEQQIQNNQAFLKQEEEYWKNHGEAILRLAENTKIRDDIMDALSEAEGNTAYELAYQVHYYEKKAGEAELEERGTIRSVVSEYMEGVLADPKRAAAYYQGLVGRQTQLMAEAAVYSQNVQTWIKEGSHGMDAYTKFADDPQILKAIGDLEAKRKYEDDLALYDKLIDRVPEKYRKQDKKEITENYLKSQKKEIREGYEYFTRIDPEAISDQVFISYDKDGIEITEKTIELHSKHRQERQLENEVAEERAGYKNLFDRLTDVNESDRSILYDLKHPFNNSRYDVTVLSERETYSASENDLLANEAVFDQIFSEAMKDESFSLDDFSVNLSSIMSETKRELEDGQEIARAQRVAERQKSEKGKVTTKVLYQDQNDFDRRAELVTKTKILQYMKKPGVELTYSKRLKNDSVMNHVITRPAPTGEYEKNLSDKKEQHAGKFQEAIDHMNNTDKLDLYSLKLCQKGVSFNLAKLEIDDISRAAENFDKIFSPLAQNQQEVGLSIPLDLVTNVQTLSGGNVVVKQKKLSEVIQEMERQAGVNLPIEKLSKAFVIHSMVNGGPAISFVPRHLDLNTKQGFVNGKPEEAVDLTTAAGLIGFDAALAKIEERRKETERLNQERKEREAKEFQEKVDAKEKEKDRIAKEANEEEEKKYQEQQRQERLIKIELDQESRKLVEDEVNNDLGQLEANLQKDGRARIQKDLGPRELGGVRTPLPSFTDRFKAEDFIEGFGSEEVKGQVAELLKKAGFAKPSEDGCAGKAMILYLMGSKAGEIDEMLKGQPGFDQDALKNMDIADKLLSLSADNKKALGQAFLKDLEAHPTTGFAAGSAEKTEENLAFYGQMMHNGIAQIKQLKGEGAAYPSEDQFSDINAIKEMKLTKFGFAADMAEFCETQLSGFQNFDNSVTADNPYGISKGGAFISKMSDGGKIDPSLDTQTNHFSADTNTINCILSVGGVFKTIETDDPSNQNQNRIKGYKIKAFKEAANRVGGAGLTFGNEKDDWNRGVEYRALSGDPIEDDAMQELLKVSEKDMKKALENGDAFREEKKAAQKLNNALGHMMQRENFYFYQEQEKCIQKAFHESMETEHPEIYELSINKPENGDKPFDITKLSDEELVACEKCFNQMFAPVRSAERGYLSERKSFVGNREFDDITFKFSIDKTPVMKYVTQKYPFPQNKKNDPKEWQKRHQMGKALILKAMADPKAKLSYRMGIVDPTDRAFKDGLLTEMKKASPDAALQRAQKQEYYKNNPAQVMDYADALLLKEKTLKEQMAPEGKKAGENIQPQKPQDGVVTLYERALARFNTKRLSIFEQESSLHASLREAAEAMKDFRAAGKKGMTLRLSEAQTKGDKTDFAVDWLMTAQEVLSLSQEYIDRKNPFTFAGADRYGGARDLEAISKKEVQICKDAISKLENEGISLKSICDKIAFKKKEAAERQLNGEILEENILGSERNVDYDRLNAGDKSERAFAKDLLIDTLASHSTHELLEQGQNTDFYAVRNQLRKDRTLSNALDRYLTGGNLSKEAMSADLEGGLKGLAGKLGNLRALENIRSMQQRDPQKANLAL